VAGICRSPAGSVIAALEASQHAVARELLLGSLSAHARLQAIADEMEVLASGTAKIAVLFAERLIGLSGAEAAEGAC
jgi:hypothetical protein